MLGLPKSTECQKIIPKKAIYTTSGLNNATRDRLDADIKRVTIVNVISPQTLAIKAGESATSVYVALVSLKRQDYDEKSITTLTKLVKQNMLLILECDGKARLAVFHTKLLCSEWAELDALTVRLNGLDMDALWENVVVQVGGVQIEEGNTLTEQIKQDEVREEILKQIEKLEKQARKENNPRKKFDLVQKAKELKRMERI